MWSISKKKSQNEVRKNKRLILSIQDPKAIRKYTVKYNEPQKGVIYEGILQSISDSGMFVGTQQIPDVNQTLELRFTFVNRRIQCLGQVIYVNRVHGFRPQGFGVRFIRMFHADYMNIQKRIEEMYAQE